MKIIAVASHNPVKLQAAMGAFERMFPGEQFEARPVKVPSGVDVQPRSDEETLRGALNRARACQEAYPQADYWAGIEGGVAPFDDELTAFAWAVVLDAQRCGKARSAAFSLPAEVARLVAGGYELGDADDIVFGVKDSKQENGAVGLLTGNAIDRRGLYEDAVLLALVPFKNPEMYA